MEQELKHYNITTPEIKKLNICLFGASEGLYPNNYINSTDVITKIDQWFDSFEKPIKLGTRCKYYNQLCNMLNLIPEFPSKILSDYTTKFKELDKKYNLEIKTNNEQKEILNQDDFNELIGKIQTGIDLATHQSIKIIGKFYMYFDSTQKDMLLMKLKDFSDTKIDEPDKNGNFLDLETGKWTINSMSFTINKSFCDYVKEQHGTKNRTNLQFLVGQRNTFIQYTNTSTLSTEFIKVFKKVGIESFNHLIDKFKGYLKWINNHNTDSLYDSPSPSPQETTPLKSEIIPVPKQQETTTPPKTKLKLKIKVKTIPQIIQQSVGGTCSSSIIPQGDVIPQTP